MARVRDYRREQSPDRGLHGQRLNRETSRYAGRAAFHRPRGPATAVPSHPPGLGGDETGHGQVTWPGDLGGGWRRAMPRTTRCLRPCARPRSRRAPPAPARWTSGRRPPCRAHGGARLRAWRCRLAT